MDHLPMPKDRNALNITVPYLVTSEVEYDGLGFESFPRRRGFLTEDAHVLTFKELQQKPASFADAFV